MATSPLYGSTTRQRVSGCVSGACVGGGSGPGQCALGRVLSGRLRIERVIGMGSMGIVLQARHLELDTRVAVKAMLPDLQELPGMLSLFAREAKAAVELHSEHVARVFDAGVDSELGPYIVMEYLEGQDLRAVLELRGRVPVMRAIDYSLQACEALAVAHARGVIHRDIKPGNLFLTRHGELEIIKLLDFGVSKAALTGNLFGGELAREDAAVLMGTPLYMSPEQARAPERVDQRSDIWGLGTVLYELVTGHSAFPRGADLPSLLTSICNTSPRPLAEHSAELAPLQSIIDQCLDKNPARRFQNVAELGYALFPFASPRAQLHAHRAASILGTSSAAAASATLRGAQPAGALARRSSGRPTLERARASRTARVASHAAGRSAWRSSGGRVLPCLWLAALLLEPGGLPSAEQGAGHLQVAGSEQPRPSVSASVLSSGVAPGLGAGVTPLDPTPARPAAPSSRAVVVDSQPSGAVVRVDGQVIGTTPLSTALPLGAVLLSLAKPGYAEAREVLHIEPAEPGGNAAAPMAVRVVLWQTTVERALRASRGASLQATRVSRARAPAPAPASAEPVPSARQSQPASVTAAPAGADDALTSSPRRPRLRLVEDTVRLHVATRL